MIIFTLIRKGIGNVKHASWTGINVEQRKMSKCPTCGRTHKRSTEANRRYWLLVNAISEKIHPEEKTYSPETWHVYFKQKYLGNIEFTMPNGNTVLIPRSTTELDTSEFNDYMIQVELWANSRNVYLDM